MSIPAQADDLPPDFERTRLGFGFDRPGIYDVTVSKPGCRTFRQTVRARAPCFPTASCNAVRTVQVRADLVPLDG